MELGGVKKRGKPDGELNGNGGYKKSKQELESFTPGLGGKTKPCTKFFSTSGCPFGENCHFVHYVPGGIKSVSQILPPTIKNHPSQIPPSFPDGSSPPPVKTRLCNKFNSAEGCKFGDKCHFAHGEWELGKPTIPSSLHNDPSYAMTQTPLHYGGAHAHPTPPDPLGFGASAAAKISIDGALAGPIIGKGGVNSKQICRSTGVKFSIRDHESDPGLKNIELEGSFDQIKQASQMVRELIVNVSSGFSQMKNTMAPGAFSATNHKTKLCENFAKGTCTFGDRCRFAHGEGELRKLGV